MIAKVTSGVNMGLDGQLVDVEVDVYQRGLPSFNIVGLPSKAIDEAKERIRSAIYNSGFKMPDSRITVNLAPANLPKVGTGFDLPMAVGILAASGVIDNNYIEDCLFIGELSLIGGVRSVYGVLPVLIEGQKKGKRKFFIPTSNASEATLIAEKQDFYLVNNLQELVNFFLGKISLTKITSVNWQDLLNKPRLVELDFADIRGQMMAKRALEIAASGFHNVYLKGPPGTGKTLLAKAFTSILPPLTKEEVVELTKIYSVAGLLNGNGFIDQRPFRSPHHTVSKIGLIGGGSNPLPGEISLAHNGVLFLDELTEFQRDELEALRQPLEDGQINISRAGGRVTFPCRFILLAASNPCPCGYLGHPKKVCICSPSMIIKYKKKLSGPILDRIDLFVDVPALDFNDLNPNKTLNDNSMKIRERIIEAIERQRKRFENENIKYNSQMRPNQIKRYCRLSEEANDLLKTAVDKLSLSARSYFKIIKVSQTIADLRKVEIIDDSIISEALSFRGE